MSEKYRQKNDTLTSFLVSIPSFVLILSANEGGKNVIPTVSWNKIWVSTNRVSAFYKIFYGFDQKTIGENEFIR